jgi:hypothetical protein
VEFPTELGEFFTGIVREEHRKGVRKMQAGFLINCLPAEHDVAVTESKYSDGIPVPEDMQTKRNCQPPSSALGLGYRRAIGMRSVAVFIRMVVSDRYMPQ